MPISRRIVLKSLGMVSFLEGPSRAAEEERGGEDRRKAVEVSVTPIGPSIVRISMAPIGGRRPQPIPADRWLDYGSVGLADPPPHFAGRAPHDGFRRLWVTVSQVPDDPNRGKGRPNRAAAPGGCVDRLARVKPGRRPVLGLGEGRPAVRPWGSADRMRCGEGGTPPDPRRSGPHPWLIGTSGWAMLIHRAYESVDLTGGEGKYIPRDLPSSLPLKRFVVTSRKPARVMAEYTRLTGFPGVPAALVARVSGRRTRPWPGRGGPAEHGPPREEAAVRRR